MEISGVDPRDCVWQDDRPVYRVYFWHQPPRPADLPADVSVMYHCDEHRIVGADDVHQVVAWADDRLAAGDTYTLYAETASGRPEGGVGLLLLAGVDPTESTGPASSATLTVHLPG